METRCQKWEGDKEMHTHQTDENNIFKDISHIK